MFRRTLLNTLKKSIPQSRRGISNIMMPSQGAKFGAFAGLTAGTFFVFANYSSSEASKDEIGAIKKEIIAAIDAEFLRRNDGTSIAGTLLRLAWHQCGTFSVVDNTGGSNGACMRFSPEADWGANAGLKSARDFLEPIKQKHPNITYADLWTLAGVTAIESMGGPTVEWKQGRSDAVTGTTVPDGRLPNADSGSVKADVEHLRSIFNRQGFTDREIVALSGAHAVGRCHTEASGYWGPWTNAETTFSNEYFRLLLEEKWTPKKTHLGKVGRYERHLYLCIHIHNIYIYFNII